MTLLNDTQLGLAKRLRAARLLADIEQAEIADAIGVGGIIVWLLAGSVWFFAANSGSPDPQLVMFAGAIAQLAAYVVPIGAAAWIGRLVVEAITHHIDRKHL